MPTLNEAMVRQEINAKLTTNFLKAITGEVSNDIANLLVSYINERNILTLISSTATTVTIGAGGNVEVEEGPSVYPSLNITFL